MTKQRNNVFVVMVFEQFATTTAIFANGTNGKKDTVCLINKSFYWVYRNSGYDNNSLFSSVVEHAKT